MDLFKDVALEDEEEDSADGPRTNQRNRRKKEKKLLRKRELKLKGEQAEQLLQPSASTSATTSTSSSKNVIIEYVVPTLSELEGSSDPELALIYKQFIPTIVTSSTSEDTTNRESEDGREGKEEFGDEENVGSDDNGHLPGDASSILSRRQRKKLLYSDLALLKREVSRPDVVEAHDVNAYDPKLLVYLKSLKNTVPVPRHWSQKAKYLQGKKGLVKPSFQLPDFITATGITRLRTTDADKQDSLTLKAKTRERMQPKMGRIEIEYQVLHDAFFIHQTKPKMTSFGDLYYEGKEYEKSQADKKPGVLSTRLRIALGMQAAPMEGVEGSAVTAFNASSAAISLNTPPPWLVNMQRYGPPPSYLGMRIPGLNAPIPKGARFGFGPGEWGRPPVDENGTPLYGDVFGEKGDNQDNSDSMTGTGAVKNLWGEVKSLLRGGGGGGGGVSASSSTTGGGGDPSNTTEAIEQASLEMPQIGDESSSSAVNASGKVDGTASEFTDDGSSSHVSSRLDNGGGEGPEKLVSSTSGGTSSLSSSSSSSSSSVELRKGGTRKATDATNDAAIGGRPPKLYTVLEERKTELSGGLLGTTTAYVIPAANAPSTSVPVSHSSLSSSASGTGTSGAASGTVSVTLNPEDLGRLDEAEIAKLYDLEAARAASAKASQKEDFSDLINEQEKKRANLAKRKGEDGGGGGGGKKAKKEFKF